jgi:hypothetical protein
MKASKKGKIKNATKIEFEGLIFKSKLELFTYNKLIEAGITDFKYEDYKFTLIESFECPFESYEVKKDKSFAPVTPNIRSMTYLPDFTRLDDNGKGWIIEVKGYNNDSFPNKWKLFKQHLVENDYEVTLYKPNNQMNVLKAIDLIKSKYYA